MIRLNKYLAERGVCARRKADVLIASGAVFVDGRKAKVGESLDDPDRHAVTVNGRSIQPAAARRETIVLNKPAGVVTTMHDEHGRPCVADLLPKTRRFVPVGRLDAESTGVLLCTTDGDLARILTHPSFGVEKVYRVHARGEMSDQTKSALGADRVRRVSDGEWSFNMILREGRNRQVRRMCAARGLRVLSLTRTQFGPVRLGDLAPGKTRSLTQPEKVALERLRAVQKRAPVQPTE